MSAEHIVVNDLGNKSWDVDASVGLARNVEAVGEILWELGEEILESISVVRRSCIVGDVFHVISRS